MERLFKNSRRLIASLGVAAFLMVAGWQVGLSGTDAVFSETELALENAVANSGGPSATVPCKNVPQVGGEHQARICVLNGEAYCERDYYDIWGPQSNGTCSF